MRHNEEVESEDEKTFVSAKAHALWNKQLAYKGFISKRGFGKPIFPFSEIIEKKGWDFFCKKMALGFAVLAREFYSNMLEMREESIYVRGVWVPFRHKRINEVFQLKELKHDSKLKKLVENPDDEKIVNLLTTGKGKWESTKKNSHQSINRGSLTEEAKVWFYFIASVIIPTKHLCSVREQEAIILYALLKGYKMNVGRLTDGSIKGYHQSRKRGLIPHPATITRLCILAGVKGIWEEEEVCPRVSSLTLTGVTKGPRNRKRKGIIEMEAKPIEGNDNMEIENFLGKSPLAEEEEMQYRMNPLSHSCPDRREKFPKPAENSRRNEGTVEIMEILISMKKEMEDRERSGRDNSRSERNS